jgi:cleavage and polyadenylation specificity factor subunit 2
MREEEADTSDSESGSSDDSDSGEDGSPEQKHQIEGVDWNTLNNEDAGLKHQSFDIYVKGHLTKTATFFKTSDAGTPRYRMFPYIERKRRFDDFGEIIDVSAWLRKGKILDQDVESDEMKAARLKKAGEVQKVFLAA